MKTKIAAFVIMFLSLVISSSVFAEGYLVTSDLWIKAVINTVEKGPIDAMWQKGGEDTTSRGDRVIWGHFYASPNDVTWGSQNNPDLFVKIWFDVSGRVDVNFFHVSVPDIEVYSDYPYDGMVDEQGTTTMDRRYIRQYYEGGQSYSDENYEDGNPPSGYTPTGNPSGYSIINDLRIGSIINTVEKGSIDGVWRSGGQDTTARGDQVVWGHFYANPNDVTWGSSNNPDLFVKIWFDVSGRVDVNFFHVSVPDIEGYSDLPIGGDYDQKGTTIMDNRYIRHEYRSVSPDLSNIGASWSADKSSAVMADTDRNVMVVQSDSVVWTAPDGESFVVYYGDNGLPTRAVGGGSIILYENWTNDTVDIAIISPDGLYTIIREIAVDPNLVSSLRELSVSPKAITALTTIPLDFSTINLATALEIGGKILNAAHCGVEIYIAVQTAGFSWASAVWACKSTALMIATALAGEDNALVEATGDTLTVINLVEGCSDNPVSCASALAGLAGTILEESESTQDDLSPWIAEAEVALSSGNDGLVAYYPFNGNANDGSGNGNDGTVYGATLTEDRFGNPNSAYSFDGTDDYIKVPNSDSLNFEESISISFWVKLETSAPYYFPYHIIEKYGSWGIGQREWDINSGITGSSGDGYNVWTTDLRPEVYYNFVMTFDGSILKVYKNGLLSGSKDYVGEIAQTDSNIMISNYEPRPDLDYHFDGIIDDIRIYNRALSESEIQELY